MRYRGRTVDCCITINVVPHFKALYTNLLNFNVMKVISDVYPLVDVSSQNPSLKANANDITFHCSEPQMNTNLLCNE